MENANDKQWDAKTIERELARGIPPMEIGSIPRFIYGIDDVEPEYRSEEERRAVVFLDSLPSSNYGRNEIPSDVRVAGKIVGEALSAYGKAHDANKAAERAVDKSRDDLNRCIEDLVAALALVGATNA